MAKKIRVHNSPFNREFEKPSDIQRWHRQGVVYEISGGEYAFTMAFATAIRREQTLAKSVDPGYDDGILRRWTARLSGGISTQQLLPVKYVGTAPGTTARPDKLKRRDSKGGIPIRHMQRIPVGAQ